MHKTSLEHWERYHRGGALASYPTTAQGEYDKEVRGCWEAFFTEVAENGRIVDIGTGNGAIAQIARDLADRMGLSWEIHGIDLAGIDPMRHVPDAASRLRGIQFHPGVAAEKLPFENGSVAALSGHNALEYCDIVPALLEARRVLAPGGRAQFVVHHLDSALVQNAMLALDDAEKVKESRIYRQLRRLLLVDADKTELLRRRQIELQQAIRYLQQILAAQGNGGNSPVLGVTLDAVRQLLELRRTQTSATVEQRISSIESDFRCMRKRLNELVAHARDESAIELLQDQCRQAAFAQVQAQPLIHDGDRLVGWLLSMS